MDVLKVLVGELKMDMTFNCRDFVSGVASCQSAHSFVSDEDLPCQMSYVPPTLPQSSLHEFSSDSHKKCIHPKFI